MIVIGASAIVWSWRLQVVANVLQLLGILLTALGVTVVWSLLELAADKAIEAKHGLDRWWALRRRNVANRWTRLRGRPVVVRAAGGIAAFSGGGATVTIGHPEVNRDTISERDWLGFLNDQVDALRTRIHEAERARDAERRALDERLATQADELREDMFRMTQRGWRLILTGLLLSAVGTGLGIFA